MIKNKFLTVLALVTIVGIEAVVPAMAFAQDNGRNSGRPRGGWVVPCSLDGVNPVYHPKIFGDPAVAAEYGFVRSRDGSWRVQPNCRRW
jgi:hypothetical protein